MSTPRKVPPLPPVAPVCRPPQRARESLDPAPASRQKWQEAEGEAAGASAQLAVEALPHRDGRQDDGCPDKRNVSQALDARIRSESGKEAGFWTPPDTEPPPREILYLARMIGAFARHAAVQDAWAARVPLSHGILQDAVLHLNCAQRVLALRFETTDWSSRELVQRHGPVLLDLLREALPMLSEIHQAPD